MSKDERRAIISFLKKTIGEKSATTYETAIYDLAVRRSKAEGESVKDVYRKLAYEKCGELISTVSDTRKKVVADIKTDKIGWESSVYDAQRSRQSTENQKMQDKGKLVKGAFYCRDKIKCGSDECYSFQAQCRSSDEPMTTFVICSKCGLRYKFG